MRSIARALVASAVVLGACAGGEKKANTDTAAAAAAAAAAPAATPAPAPAAAPGAPAAAPAGGAAAPITGKTIEVKMVGDEKGYRFEPNNITVKQGDGIKFVDVSGGPHNVGFDPAKVPSDVQPQLGANMPGDHSMGPLEGPLLMNPNDSYTVSFAKIKPGTYPVHCTPHLALNMKGTITVQ
jgi:plastocyanin